MNAADIESRMAHVAGGLAKHRSVFIALGDENRQKILVALLGHYGGMRPAEIADAIGLSRPATSHHLKTLQQAGLVEMYERGTMNFYIPSGKGVRWDELTKLVAEVGALNAAAISRSDEERESAKRKE